MEKSENNKLKDVESNIHNMNRCKFGILDTTNIDDIEVMEKLLEEKYIEEKIKEDYYNSN